MTDFVNAFLKGQGAAANAERARTEVSEVLDALKEQILQATNGIILIELANHTFFKGKLDILNLTSMLNAPKETRKYLSAKITNIPSRQYERLAEWEQTPDGYPLTLTFGEDEVTCHDKASLEAGLAEALADTEVGEKLAKLLREAEQRPAPAV